MYSLDDYSINLEVETRPPIGRAGGEWAGRRQEVARSARNPAEFVRLERSAEWWVKMKVFLDSFNI